MIPTSPQKQETKQVPSIGKEWEIQYKASGVDIKLTPGIIRRFLVRGNAERVTDQEIVFFMKLAQARGLNPFIGDAYLIKYGEDPAAIVTAVDFFRKRARAQKDCVGWASGIIVQDKNGKIRDSRGLLLEDEKLLGGWFEATPEGWKVPFRLEVNLKGYLKFKKDGSLTRFWTEDNQPSQIAKVAESQGLRRLWPDEFQGLYTEEEMPDSDITKGAIEIDPEGPQKTFDELIHGRNTTGMDAFLAITAKAQKKPDEQTVEAVKLAASKNFDNFWEHFERWQKKQPKNGERKMAETNPSEEGTKVVLVWVDCPENPGEQRAIEYCEKTCKSKQGCPSWE